MLGLLLCLSTGCSSPPEKDYQVTEYRLLANLWMQQADRKRQQEIYPAALTLYQRAEKYALKRNDRLVIGIARLKRAAIHISLSELDKAEQLLLEVERMEQFEPAGLDKSSRFIRAKWLKAQGQVEQAKVILAELEQFYQEQPERNIYYRLVRWSYDYNSVDMAAVDADLQVLNKRVDERQLDNIEIYSFALYEYARYLTKMQDERASAAIDKAIEHFSSLELTAKIRDCYKLAADYYRSSNQLEKAEYFEARFKN